MGLLICSGFLKRVVQQSSHFHWITPKDNRRGSWLIKHALVLVSPYDGSRKKRFEKKTSSPRLFNLQPHFAVPITVKPLMFARPEFHDLESVQTLGCANISLVWRGEWQPLYLTKFNGHDYDPAVWLGKNGRVLQYVLPVLIIAMICHWQSRHCCLRHWGFLTRASTLIDCREPKPSVHAVLVSSLRCIWILSS